MKHTSIYRLSAILIILTVLILSGCASGHSHDHDHDHDHGHSHDHHDGETDGRLLIGLNSGSLLIADAHDGDILKEFHAALPAGRIAVYSNASGEFGYAINRDESVTVVIDSGQKLVEHDGHEDLVFDHIEILGLIEGTLRPTHFTTTFGKSGIYNDGSGDITIIDEQLLRRDFQTALSLVPSREDHGAPVLLHDKLLVGYVNETSIDLLDYEGNVLQQFPGIGRAHGQARVGRFTAFGAVEGVMIITQQGSDFSAHMVGNPEGTAEGVRTGRVLSHPALPHFIGNLGPNLVVVDPAELSSRAVELPAAQWQMNIDRSGHYLAVLGQDGALYTLDAESLELIGSVQVTEARDPDAAAGTPLPSLTLGRGTAFVSRPSDNSIIEIDLKHSRIERSVQLDSTAAITGITLMTTDGIVH
ncbi:hypothetical protein [Spirochaeta dissipatitropha]